MIEDATVRRAIIKDLIENHVSVNKLSNSLDTIKHHQQKAMTYSTTRPEAGGLTTDPNDSH